MDEIIFAVYVVLLIFTYFSLGFSLTETISHFSSQGSMELKAIIVNNKKTMVTYFFRQLK